MDLSFHEKSLWLMLASLLCVYIAYFAIALPAHPVDVGADHVGLFVAAVAALVVTQVAGHILLAIVDRRSEPDERDRAIALVGTRNAAWVLSTGVFAALCAALLSEGNFVFTHVLLVAWVLAQLVEIVSQLVLHRRGV